MRASVVVVAKKHNSQDGGREEAAYEQGAGETTTEIVGASKHGCIRRLCLYYRSPPSLTPLQTDEIVEAQKQVIKK